MHAENFQDIYISLLWNTHDTDMIPVSFYCLRSQLSFDIPHLMFMHYINSSVMKCCYSNDL